MSDNKNALACTALCMMPCAFITIAVWMYAFVFFIQYYSRPVKSSHGVMIVYIGTYYWWYIIPNFRATHPFIFHCLPRHSICSSAYCHQHVRSLATLRGRTAMPCTAYHFSTLQGTAVMLWSSFWWRSQGREDVMDDPPLVKNRYCISCHTHVACWME